MSVWDCSSHFTSTVRSDCMDKALPMYAHASENAGRGETKQNWASLRLYGDSS